MTLNGGKTLSLTAEGPLNGTAPGSPEVLSATLTIVEDSAYRVALTDREGLSNPGDTEYFIRVLEDRPPDVHITRPAGDRSVTRLEEVDIEAQADDDYGVERLELVYAVRGGTESVIALPTPPHATSVSARHTLYFEDLDVQPGDFVRTTPAPAMSRAVVIQRGAQRHLFPRGGLFEQEFALTQSWV